MQRNCSTLHEGGEYRKKEISPERSEMVYYSENENTNEGQLVRTEFNNVNILVSV